jgi:hypothetical protein
MKSNKIMTLLACSVTDFIGNVLTSDVDPLPKLKGNKK